MRCSWCLSHLKEVKWGFFCPFPPVTCAEHQLPSEGTFLVPFFVCVACLFAAPDSFRISLARGGDGKTGLLVGGAKYMQTNVWFLIFISYNNNRIISFYYNTKCSAISFGVSIFNCFNYTCFPIHLRYESLHSKGRMILRQLIQITLCPFKNTVCVCNPALSHWQNFAMISQFCWHASRNKVLCNSLLKHKDHI